MVGLPTRFFDADVGIQLNFTIVQADGTTRQDITGGTLTLVVENLPGSPLAPVVIDDAANGLCHYIIAAGDFPYGVYRAQLRLFFSANTDFRTEIFALNAGKAL